MTYKSYYVPNFPVNKITDDGRDGWIDMPNHPRNRYRVLDAILEHIDNTNHIDPIKIRIPVAGQVQAGPQGVARLYALRYIRNYTHVPAIVCSPEYFEWFGQDVVEIKDSEQVRSYLLLEPVDYGLNSEGEAFWVNQNPNEKQLRETFKVSPETLHRTLLAFELIS